MAGDGEVLFDVIVLDEAAEDNTDGDDELSEVGVMVSNPVPGPEIELLVPLAVIAGAGEQPVSPRNEIKDCNAVDFAGPSTDPGTVWLS